LCDVIVPSLGTAMPSILRQHVLCPIVPDRTPHYPDLVLQAGTRSDRRKLSGSATVHTDVTRGSNMESRNTMDAVSPSAIKERFSMARQPLTGQGLLIVEASRSHSDTPHSVGLLWTGDLRDAETST